MAVTPEAAMMADADGKSMLNVANVATDLMEIDHPVSRGGEANEDSDEGQQGRNAKSSVIKDNLKSKTAAQEEDEEGDEGDSDGDEETFAVERVLNHRIKKKSNGEKGYQFYIKWLGYEKESDNTWEDEENCVGSQSLVDAYWERLGGKPSISGPQKPGPKKRMGTTPASENGSSKKQRRQTQTKTRDESPSPKKSPEASLWNPPSDLQDWEDRIVEVDTVERMTNGLIVVYLTWKNGRRSCHDTTVVYQKCPQHMLQFYESHLIFKDEITKLESTENGLKEER